MDWNNSVLFIPAVLAFIFFLLACKNRNNDKVNRYHKIVRNLVVIFIIPVLINEDLNFWMRLFGVLIAACFICWADWGPTRKKKNVTSNYTEISLNENEIHVTRNITSDAEKIEKSYK